MACVDVLVRLRDKSFRRCSRRLLTNRVRRVAWLFASLLAALRFAHNVTRRSFSLTLLTTSSEKAEIVISSSFWLELTRYASTTGLNKKMHSSASFILTLKLFFAYCACTCCRRWIRELAIQNITTIIVAERRSLRTPRRGHHALFASAASSITSCDSSLRRFAPRLYCSSLLLPVASIARRFYARLFALRFRRSS